MRLPATLLTLLLPRTGRIIAENDGRLIEADLGLSAATGTGRGSAALSGAGVGGIYGADSAPFFSYENTGSSAAMISIRWVWRE